MTGQHIVELLAGVASEVGAVGKTDRNEHQRFMFRGIDAVVNAVAKPLHDAGVFGPVPRVLKVDRTETTTSNNKATTVVVVTVEYTLTAPPLVEGGETQTLSGVVVAEAFDSGDKATAKAMSVAMRTFLLQALCLPTDEPDPDSYTYERTAGPSAEELVEAAAKATSIDQVRAVWRQAHAAGHGAEVLDEIKAVGDALAQRPDEQEKQQ